MNKKDKLVYKRVPVDVYETCVHFVFTKDKDKALKKIKTLIGDNLAPISEYSSGSTYDREGSPPVIWLPREPKSKKDRAILSHELIHAATSILGFRGIETNQSNDEPMAYLIAHLYRNI